jgi:hypothetical protein
MLLRSSAQNRRAFAAALDLFLGAARLGLVGCLCAASLSALTQEQPADPKAAPQAPRVVPQDPKAARDPGAEVERLLGMTKTGSPVVRPQAAQRLVRLGAPALAAIRARIAAEPRGLELLGPELLGELGAFDDTALEQDLRAALTNRDFPWRPAVLRALAQSPGLDDLPAFRAALGDVLAAAREAGLSGLEELQKSGQLAAVDRGELEFLVRARLLDSSDGVRRRAALLLDRWGYPGCLAFLLEDLQRSDRFYDLDSGGAARRAAAQQLLQRLREAPQPFARAGGPALGGGATPPVDSSNAQPAAPSAAESPGEPTGDEAGASDPLCGFDARQPHTTPDNQRALAALTAALKARAGDEWPAELPTIARAGGPTPELVLGIELRSCRRGEAWLGLTGDDGLLIGQQQQQRLSLPAGASKRLVAAAENAQKLLSSEVFGRPGCDLERYRFGVNDGPAAREWHVLKDPDPADDLRPEAIDAFARALLAELAGAGSEGMALMGELSGLFASIGGPF